MDAASTPRRVVWSRPTRRPRSDAQRARRCLAGLVRGNYILSYLLHAALEGRAAFLCKFNYRRVSTLTLSLLRARNRGYSITWDLHVTRYVRHVIGLLRARYVHVIGFA